MTAVITEMAGQVPVQTLCAALGFPRSTYYRQRQPAAPAACAERRPSSRALSAAEQAAVHAVLNSARFADLAPRQVYATLLDEGVYHCSISSMYRILTAHGEINERRPQRTHPAYVRPELLATGPNQVWSWDITWLRGPGKWQHYYLYVVVDIFSRYIVGWLLAEEESADLAQQLLGATCAKYAIAPNQLTIHADRGAAMTSQPVAQLLANLGVTKSHARPYTADDNPFSEAQFKTMKYRPDYPARFESLAAAQTWVTAFVAWYNHQHHHSNLGLMTPATVYWGHDQRLTAARQHVLHAAYAAHPERFVKGVPVPPHVPDAVWINPPAQVTGPPAPATHTEACPAL